MGSTKVYWIFSEPLRASIREGWLQNVPGALWQVVGAALLESDGAN